MSRICRSCSHRIKTIQRWIRSGKLSASQVDGRWHVHVEEQEKEHNVPNEGHGTPHEEQAALCERRALKAQLERADSEIQYLRQQLTEKDNQLSRRDEQIDHLTQLLAMQSKTTAALTERLGAIEDMRRLHWWKRLIRRFDERRHNPSVPR